MGHCEMASAEVQVVFCNACQHVFCNKRNGNDPMIQAFDQALQISVSLGKCIWISNLSRMRNGQALLQVCVSTKLKLAALMCD